MGRSVLTVDGGYGEGGGQLLRTALSLAAITGRAVRVEHIRARRPNPGLRPQHLTAVRAVAQVCAAKVEGAQLGSRDITFAPTSPPRAGSYHWSVGTAGAVSLIFQAVLWPLAMADGCSEVTLVGGTHVEWSPPIDYLQHVYLPTLNELLTSSQAIATIEVERWGWYPRGGGIIRARIEGNTHLRGLRLNGRGALREVKVLSAASNLPEHVRRRQAERADFVLRKRGIKAQVEAISPPSPGRGTMVFILAQYKGARAGFTAYGRLRKPAERVAEEACRAFFRYHKRARPVDAHLGDQLLLPLCLAEGDSEYAVEEVTQHLLTQAWVIRQFLQDVRIEIAGSEGQPGVVKIRT